MKPMLELRWKRYLKLVAIWFIILESECVLLYCDPLEMLTLPPFPPVYHATQNGCTSNTASHSQEINFEWYLEISEKIYVA